MVEQEKVEKTKPVRIIVELEPELVDAIEIEQRLAPGKLPSRAQMIRDLLEEGIAARKLGRAKK